MTWRRRVKAALAGLLTTTGVMLAWPDGPLWTAPLDPVGPRPVSVAAATFDARHPCNRPLGFTPDGNTVFAVDRLAAASRPAVLRSWDAATGRPGSDVPLPPSVRADAVLRLTPDGRRLLVWNVPSADGPGERVVLDVADGRTVCTIAARRPHLAPVAFLAGGRLFWTEEFRGDTFTCRDVDVYETATGERVAGFSSGRGLGRWLHGVTFTPDGTAAALLWASRGLSGAEDVVEVMDLPAKTVAHSTVITAPATRQWEIGRHAIGRRFALRAFDVKPPPAAPWPWQAEPSVEVLQRTLSFDGGTDTAADEPADRTVSLPGWALSLPDTRPAVVTWAVGRLPAGVRRFLATKWLAGRFDTDGGTVACEVPNRKLPLTTVDPAVAISPAGRWLAVATADGALELWDIAPRLRWPWAVAAGVLAGGAVAVAGRKRFRKAMP